MRSPPSLSSPAKPKAAFGHAASVFNVVHAGVTYRVAVKRVGAARRFTLRVRLATQDTVLTMPARASLRAARSFAERHAEWIGTRLQGLPRRRLIAPGALVPFRGVDHRIVHDPIHRALRRVGVEAPPAGGEEVPVLRVSGPAEAVGRHVVDFLRREAHRDFLACVKHHAAAIGNPVGRISIRDTKSRWGSCSSKGNLNFSWRLIMAPPFVLDYLAAHECAHLCHMNHSAEFWTVTRRLAPRTDAAEDWLRAHGTALHLYGI